MLGDVGGVGAESSAVSEIVEDGAEKTIEFLVQGRTSGGDRVGMGPLAQREEQRQSIVQARRT